MCCCLCLRFLFVLVYASVCCLVWRLLIDVGFMVVMLCLCLPYCCAELCSLFIALDLIVAMLMVLMCGYVYVLVF